MQQIILFALEAKLNSLTLDEYDIYNLKRQNKPHRDQCYEIYLIVYVVIVSFMHLLKKVCSSRLRVHTLNADDF